MAELYAAPMTSSWIASEGEPLKRLLIAVRADYARFVKLIAQSDDRTDAAARLSAVYGCPVELASTLLDQQFFQLIGAAQEKTLSG